MGELTWEHRYFFDVVEPAEILAFKTGPQVRNENLSSLVKAHRPAFKSCLISEAGKLLGKKTDELQR